jgi:hypothetical protein
VDRRLGVRGYNIPVVLTEIGFCGPDDKGAHVPVISDESYGDAITAYADANGISYVVWVFDPQWSPMCSATGTTRPPARAATSKRRCQVRGKVS